MVKLGCTLPNLKIISLQKSTNHKFYSFFEGYKDSCQKNRDDITGGPSLVLGKKLLSIKLIFVTRQIFPKKSVEIDASQFYPFSLCQEMPTGLYTRWEYDSETDRFKARNYKNEKFREHCYVLLSRIETGV